MSGKDEKLSLQIRRYLLNLSRAFFGMNPYRDELKQMKEKYEKTAAKVAALERSLSKLEDLAAMPQVDAGGLVSRLSAKEEELASRDRLIENLRERIAEKNAEIERQGLEFHERVERVKAEYQRRIEEYNVTVDGLKKALAERADAGGGKASRSRKKTTR